MHRKTPKNGKSRRVDMSMQLAETIWLLKRDREMVMGENMPEWVFIKQAGKPVSGDNWRKRVFTEALENAELWHIRINDLRHTNARLLLQTGESIVYFRD